MCRKKNRAKNGRNSHNNNGNGKEPKGPTDQVLKKPTGFRKGYPPHSKENGSGVKKNKPANPKSFQEGMSKNSAAFFEKMFKHRNRQEGFLEGPNFP